MRLLLAFLLMAAAGPLRAGVDRARYEPVLKQADAAFAGPQSPARLEAMAAVHRATLELGSPERAKDETPAWWFGELRGRAAKSTDPEVGYFLSTEVRFDPAVPALDMADGKPVAKVPYQPGQGVMASLADTARSLDLGEKPRLSADQLKAMAVDETLGADESKRALVLLRRVDPVSAAPLLWKRMGTVKQRSDVLYWEEQLMRLPVNAVGAVAYDEKVSTAAKAAWLRLAAVRPSLPVTSPDRAGWIALLKGPANEVTEAAWDAAPRVFHAADRAELSAIAKEAPERLAPRIKVALERLR